MRPSFPTVLCGGNMNLSSLLSAMPGAIAQGLIWGIMAIGVYITYKVLDVADLTVDGTMATGGVVCVALMVNGVPLWVALLCAVLAGMLAGLLTGVFHPAILSGILTQFSLYSINLWIMGFKSNMAINVTRYHLLVSGRNVKKLAFSNPIFVVAVAIVLLILVLYWFFGTERGCALRATGANPAMARAMGINTARSKILGLMNSNGIVALSSALFTQYQGAEDVNMGRGPIVIGLAAVIISEVAFSAIFHNFGFKLLGVALGAVIYYMVIQVVLWLKLNPLMLKLFSAMVVALFLAIPYWKEKLAARVSRKGGSKHA